MANENWYPRDPHKKSSRRNWGCFVFILAAVLFWARALIWVHGAIWGEREGFIKTEDCRTKIPVKQGSPDTWFKKFTCTYEKTDGGRIVGGFCQAVETDDAGVCTLVYSYEKKPENPTK
jgi:hypothetical protein